MKAGDTVELTSGRSFLLPLDGVKAVGKGGGKQWQWSDGTVLQDEEWRPLYDALSDYNTRERNEVCKMYSVSYQKMISLFQPVPNRVVKKESSIGLATGGADNPLNRIELVKAKIQKHRDAIEELEKELAELADDGAKLLEAQLAELKKYQRVRDAVDEMPEI